MSLFWKLKIFAERRDRRVYLQYFMYTVFDVSDLQRQRGDRRVYLHYKFCETAIKFLIGIYSNHKLRLM